MVFEHGDTTNGTQVTALWDTGATNSVITQRVVNTCGLKPTGTARVDHAQGTIDNVPTFLVDIELPNSVLVEDLTVTLGVLQVDVLIGMDIIGRGDFAVTHPSGYTKFTFSMPASRDIDFFRDSAPANELALVDRKLKAQGLPGVGPIRRRRRR